MRLFSAYAGPSTWGPWVTVAEHLGVVTYAITASAVSDTILRNRVRYYRAANDQVIKEWDSSVSITTGNVVAGVEVCFMGLPTGSPVDGTIQP